MVTGRDALSAVVALAYNRSARPSDIADNEGFAGALLALLLFVVIAAIKKKVFAFDRLLYVDSSLEQIMRRE